MMRQTIFLKPQLPQYTTGSQFENNCDFVFLDQTGAQNHIDVTYSVKPYQNGLTKRSEYSTMYETDLGCFSGKAYTLDTCKYYGITLSNYTENRGNVRYKI